ncbi:hypothetical protein BX661DRAFT_171914 [Kickxella alabastrina]|uniref:uncharacterized protein n=1 Tax=Kickxella alabastrina TaxID=61397 RepID=UPI00221F0831|nr:uncharacterized protein BX661DRAFT_207375 [Kickxella alabastrina]XP_051390894.1 uncharacterized protein BX661DRAFT_171914 [Kickxella alabastrina]KAI7822313.1 hypothetical protein BX661DRAFT_207375 [Kickxella alabastrina]KAI7825967.1 hypothetical protein BX661DRAFT_171914 [Kickxella alabastrina]KAJ1946792.1 mitotic fidelity of chromosome transmission- protein [Kickxella alabastrina]
MSNRTSRRAKSPAMRNNFSDIGVTGRKTGVRAAGGVTVDNDGLENVVEFYNKTSPTQPAKPTQPQPQTLHALLSPTPIRSIPAYDTLMGALDMGTPEQRPILRVDAEEDEAIPTPLQTRTLRAQLMNVTEKETTITTAVAAPAPAPAPVLVLSQAPVATTGASRRMTMVQSKVQRESWVNSPVKNRRVTMGVTQKRADPGDELNFGPEDSTDELNFGPLETQSRKKLNGASATENKADENDNEEERYVHVEDADQKLSPVESAADNDNEEEEEPQFNLSEPEQDDNEVPDQEPEQEMPEDEVIPDSQEPAPEVSEAEQDPTLEDQSGDQSVDHSAEQPRRQKQIKAKSMSAEQPIRRSTRATIQPLAYWRNEHVEYEYSSGPLPGVPVPKLKNVVRVRQTAEEKKYAKRRRTKHSLPSLRHIPRSELDPSDRGQFFYYDDENYGFPVKGDSSGRYGPRYTEKAKARGSTKRSLDDMDDNDDIPVDERPKVVLMGDGVERTQEIAISRQSIEWSNMDTEKDKYKVGMGLFVEQSEGSVDASSGVISMAVGGQKPARTAGPRTLFYLVTSGQVEVQVHGSVFRVGMLGQFMVPRNNTYSIKNVGTHPAQLYYVHVSPLESVTENVQSGGSAAAEHSDSDIE